MTDLCRIGSEGFDPRILRRVKLGQLTVMADIYCPTWQHEPFKGWRRILIYKLGWFCLPRRWFKPPRQYRVAYMLGDTIIVSHGNYAALMEACEDGPA